MVLTGLIFCGCQPRILSVQTEYLSHINLASFHVGTPDPRLRNPPLGQKLIVNWSLPSWDQDTAFELTVKIRFKNGTSSTTSFAVTLPKGTFVFPLLNEEYFDKGGFKSYLATMKADGIVLEEWRHQLWVNLIEISENEGSEDASSEQDDEIDWDQKEDEPETDQQIYDEHYKGEGALQRSIEQIPDPTPTQYKYYF
jgi:hypothetical protein